MTSSLKKILEIFYLKGEFITILNVAMKQDKLR